MSYTPTNWQTGDTITAEKLNNIEDRLVTIEGYDCPISVDFNSGTITVNPSVYATITEDSVHFGNASPFTVSLEFGNHRFSFEATRTAYDTLDGTGTRVTFTSPQDILDGDVGHPVTYYFDTADYTQGQDWVVHRIVDASELFIVTLTPTAQDFSGTMDKTVAEINTAYEAGRNIVFRVLTSATTYVDVPMSFASKFEYAFKDFGATIILPSQNVMIAAETVATDDGTKQTYSTAVYPLTPMT